MNSKFKSKNSKLAFVACALLVSVVVPVRATHAAKVARIGYLSAASAVNDRPLLAAFRESLQSLGYIEGRDVVIEQRYAAGRSERLPGAAAAEDRSLCRVRYACRIRRKGCRQQPPDRHGEHRGSGWNRLGRQPCASRGKDHGVIRLSLCHGDETPRAFEGGRAFGDRCG